MSRCVGVIGTGAMGLGVVKSLVRAGFSVLARDINKGAEASAVASGAQSRSSPAAVARDCRTVIVLVVDAAQVQQVLFGVDGAAASLAEGSIVILSSTVAPAFVAEVAATLSLSGIGTLDAPVSGGPARATDGSMTMMLAGSSEIVADSAEIVGAISRARFVVGERPGDAATFKILNNQLAAVNLAAGAEAVALAIQAGLDPERFLEVVNASSGASWIVADRMSRALVGDYSARASTTLLAKDVGIAVATARTLGCEPSFAAVAHDVFCAAVAGGYGAEDDGSLLKFYRRRMNKEVSGGEITDDVTATTPAALNADQSWK